MQEDPEMLIIHYSFVNVLAGTGFYCVENLLIFLQQRKHFLLTLYLAS